MGENKNIDKPISSEDLALEIERKVNVMGGGAEISKMVSKLTNMHRTLIQSFVSRFIFPYVRKMAKNYKEGYYDGRNELACKMCYTMWEALNREYDWIQDDLVEEKMPFQLAMI